MGKALPSPSPESSPDWRFWVDGIVAAAGLITPVLASAFLLVESSRGLGALELVSLLWLVLAVTGLGTLYIGAFYVPRRVEQKQQRKGRTSTSSGSLTLMLPSGEGQDEFLLLNLRTGDVVQRISRASAAGGNAVWSIRPGPTISSGTSGVAAAVVSEASSGPVDSDSSTVAASSGNEKKAEPTAPAEVEFRPWIGQGMVAACVTMLAVGITGTSGILFSRVEQLRRVGQENVKVTDKMLEATNAAITRLHTSLTRSLDSNDLATVYGSNDTGFRNSRWEVAMLTDSDLPGSAVGFAPLVSLEGKVESVDSQGRLKIGVSEVTGFKVGDALSVYRPGKNPQYLGRVEVTEVSPERKTISAEPVAGLPRPDTRHGDVATAVLPSTELRAAERTAMRAQSVALAQGERKSYTTASGKQTLHILPNVVAVEGERVASRIGGEQQPPQGIHGFADNTVPFSSVFADQGIYFLQVDPTQQNAIQERFSRSSSVKRAGLVARLSPSDVDPTGRSVVVVPPEFIVRFKPLVPRSRIEEINRKNSVVILREDPSIANQFVLGPADQNPERMLELTELYRNLPEFGGLCVPNFIRPRRSLSVDRDALIDLQWHLENNGRDQGMPGADIRATSAWKVTEGMASVVIAVIDSDGVQIAHEDLVDNIAVNEAEQKGRPGKDDDDNKYTDDIYGWNFLTGSGDPTSRQPHGTAVAGIVAAVKGNGLGGSGVAPGCRILPIRLGQGDDDDAKAFRYARDRGADVIVCSWGYLDASVSDAVKSAVDDITSHGRANHKGCVVVLALSNERRDNFVDNRTELVGLPNVISVGRSTNRDRWGSCGFGRGVTVLAPTGSAAGNDRAGCDRGNLAGTLEITTTDLMGAEGYNRILAGAGQAIKCECNPLGNENGNLNYTGCFHGTSASTPVVGGVCALILSVDAHFTPTDVNEILIDSADKIEPDLAAYQKGPDGRSRSATHGYGRVNAEKAVALAVKRSEELKKSESRARPEKGGHAKGKTVTSDTATSVVPTRGLGAGPVLLGLLPATVLVSDPPDPPPHGRGSAAPNPDGRAQDKGLQLELGDAEPRTLRVAGKDLAVFTSRRVWALLLCPDKNRAELLERLGEGYHPVRTAWADALDRTRSVLVVEGPAAEWCEAERAFRPAIDAGLVRSVGRVLFLGGDAPRSVIVLTGQVMVSPQPQVTENDFRRFAEGLGLNVSRNDAEATRYTLSAKTCSADPLRVAELCRKLEDAGLVKPANTRPGWIVPIEQRL